jgi:pimeloyl-ACP methyl ester carboxylesterase
MPSRVLFLPGASGAGEFWKPVAERLPREWDTQLFDWPGAGEVPSDPRVRAFGDLAELVLASIDSPVDLVAQSMGGVVAMQVALARPELVHRLVLVATSGGVDLSPFNVEDWRPEYRAEYPNAASFVTDEPTSDLSAALPTIRAPTLLLWAQSDSISPPEIGRYLKCKLTRAQARLVILERGDHMFARDYAEDVAPLIQAHLRSSADKPVFGPNRSRPNFS